MNKIFIINLILLMSTRFLYAQEKINFEKLKGIGFCLKGEVSQLAREVPCTLKEKAKLFTVKHEELTRLGLIGSYIIGQIGLQTLFHKKIDSCYDRSTEESVLFVTSVTVPFLAAVLPVIGARSLLNVIKDIPVLFQEIEKSEKFLEEKISTLTWTEKQIKAFFNASYYDICCNNRDDFLASLKNRNDSEKIESHLTCLKKDIEPQLRVLTQYLYTLYNRLGVNDEVYREKLDELIHELDFNCSIIRAVLDEAVVDDDLFKDVSDDISEFRTYSREEYILE